MPRFSKPLNKKVIDNAKPQNKPYSLTDGNGLFLLITPTGSKTWQFNYYHPSTKKRTKFSLGSYPIVTIAEARSYRDEYRSLLIKGIDPQEYLKEQEQLKTGQNENTF